MYQLILSIHIIVSVVMVGLVLIQHGKGASLGASFGSGASGTVFGSQGIGGVLFKTTGLLAFVFFITSLSLSSMVAKQYREQDPLSLMKQDARSSSIPIPLPKQS